jgi:DNA invertase Pin-like site-specific DNA recombinase
VKIGYARVSTDDQTLDIQRAILRENGCEKIFEEKVSGVGKDRPQLCRLLETLKEEDIVIVSSLDRLARSTRVLLETIDNIGSSGAKFVSLSEPWANTNSPSGKMIMTVIAGIAEFEAEMIRSRTSAGRAAARNKGVKFGRPKKLSAKNTKLAMRLLKEGQSVRDVAETFGVHTSTIYRMLNP